VQQKINDSVLWLTQDDITELAVDAIVNPANSQLVLGVGVAGAISQKGGPQIQAHCNRLKPIEVGTAVITTAGDLKAKHVIHAVGPRMGQGREDEKLSSAALNALKTADENNLTSIALPAVSTGIFGFPMDRCAEIMLKAAIDYLKGQTNIKEVIFCLFDSDAYDTFAKHLQQLAE